MVQAVLACPRVLLVCWVSTCWVNEQVDEQVCCGCNKGGGLVALVPVNWLSRGRHRASPAQRLEICSYYHHLPVSRGKGKPASLRGVPWNQQPSRTGCFSPRGCQETVLWAMLLWWQRNESKHPFFPLLSKGHSKLLKDFQKYLRIIMQSQWRVRDNLFGRVHVCELVVIVFSQNFSHYWSIDYWSISSIWPKCSPTVWKYSLFSAWDFMTLDLFVMFCCCIIIICLNTVPQRSTKRPYANS